MSNIIKVSTSKMAQDRKALREQSDRISLQMNDLVDKMEALSACWEGPAWEAYKKEVNDRIEEMHDAREFCINLSEMLEKAEEDYLRCEEAGKAEISKVRI